jgi:hypothetical protein
VATKRIEDASIKEIRDFLSTVFVPGESGLSATREIDMDRYACLAKFLSDRQKFAAKATELANVMASMLQRIRNDELLIVDFLRWLGFFAHCFGFSKNIYTISGKLDHAEFAEIVSEKILFRDIYTRPHGEFTHTLQWLVMAWEFTDILPVSQLYSNAVKYHSGNKTFVLSKGRTDKIEMWNFLVDCFEGEEDFQSNILSKTFRCPQIMTNRLSTDLPSENWLGEFIYHRRHLGLTEGTQPPPGSPYKKKREMTWPKSYEERMLKKYYDLVAKGIFKLKDNLLR